MPKYLLLKHYNGGPAPIGNHGPMTGWAPEDVTAHLDAQRRIGDELRASGEFIDAQALAPTGSYVRFGGPDAAPVTDGPFPEAKELIAGWYLVDVDSEARALEIAAHVSSAPGRGGRPLYEWIEVRPVLEDVPATDQA
ncbi:YciI family protein [Nakamurella endophytica]|uniref:Sigma associated protein n=1 Tax=Nakamurella endophytica TaxID=1748367 RepID=A0A917SRD9_9ACTN|nr:YciI family protein [Nakamurella endophytica]GGL92507.1 sigma associated protein [Nakamurella endophytica]